MCTLNILQEAQLMLTNPHDVFSDQSIHGTIRYVRYGFLLVIYSKFILMTHRF